MTLRQLTHKKGGIDRWDNATDKFVGAVFAVRKEMNVVWGDRYVCLSVFSFECFGFRIAYQILLNFGVRNRLRMLEGEFLFGSD